MDFYEASERLDFPDPRPDAFRAMLPRLRTLRDALSAEDKVGVEIAAQAIVDLLAREYDITLIPWVVVEPVRPSWKDKQGRIRGETHGLADGERWEIKLYLRTPAKKKVTSYLTFLNTLLHEFVHFYDFARLDGTLHTSGFYRRLNTLYRMLRDVKLD